MNDIKKVIRVAGVCAFLVVMAGCANVGGMASKQLANQNINGGIIYGALLGLNSINEPNEIEKVCEGIKNADPRCEHMDKYKAVGVVSKFGYMDGGVGLIALVEKDRDIGKNCRTGSKDCTYVKAQSTPGQLAKIIEIASKPGEGKCKWSGMPRAGGTVCPAFNWDYRNDNQAAVVF